MKTVAWFSATLLAAACGGDDSGGTPDAGNEADATVEEDAEVDERDITDVTTAFSENEEGNLEEVGPANWDCLGDPDDVPATENDITLSGRVSELQGGTGGEETVEVVLFGSTDFYEDPIAGPVDAVDPQDGEDSLAYEGLVLPQGATRVAFRLTTSEDLVTFSLGHQFEPGATEATRDVGFVAEGTASLLAVSALEHARTEGLGIVAGDVVDCDGNTVKHAIGALSTTSGELTPHDDSERTFYFGPLLPIRQRTETNDNGRLMVPEIEPSETPLYLQVWGYPDQESFDNEELVLLSELETTIVADGLVSSLLRPLQATN